MNETLASSLYIFATIFLLLSALCLSLVFDVVFDGIKIQVNENIITIEPISNPQQ